ncbi:MAG: hypothetical protein PHY92_03895 [Alphaproteobacteria bacterium]|nr:hypothetical protein [Alphaproteobacteria bacterium]
MAKTIKITDDALVFAEAAMEATEGRERKLNTAAERLKALVVLNKANEHLAECLLIIAEELRKEKMYDSAFDAMYCAAVYTRSGTSQQEQAVKNFEACLYDADEYSALRAVLFAKLDLGFVNTPTFGTSLQRVLDAYRDKYRMGDDEAGQELWNKRVREFNEREVMLNDACQTVVESANRSAYGIAFNEWRLLFKKTYETHCRLPFRHAFTATYKLACQIETEDNGKDGKHEASARRFVKTLRYACLRVVNGWVNKGRPEMLQLVIEALQDRESREPMFDIAMGRYAGVVKTRLYETLPEVPGEAEAARFIRLFGKKRSNPVPQVA